MYRNFSIRIAAALVICAVCIGFLALGAGLAFTSHEADMVHLAELVLRTASGETPHRDFMTPIGGWAVQPMAVLMRAGFGLGSAMIWSQIFVLAAFFPILIWIGATRLTLRQFLVLFTLVSALVVGLVFGQTEPLISLSMHYNRWCWAGVILVAVMVFLAPKDRSSAHIDGVMIGLIMVALAMTKVTFSIALAIPVIATLLRTSRSKTLVFSILTAATLLIFITIFTGLSYWQSYANDLFAVMASSNRPMPSAHWTALVMSPSGAPITMIVAFAIWALHKAGRRGLGTALLLFYPAFVFIAWQNFGNDPIWLAGMALVLWAISDDLPSPKAVQASALVAAAMIAPVILNIGFSPLRHALVPSDQTRPMLSDHPGLRMITARGEGAWVKITSITPPAAEQTEFQGITLPDCELTGGLIATLERDTMALFDLVPDMDRQPLVADLFSPHWMFGQMRPLKGGTPWYYDGLPGLRDATHLMVPDCPADTGARARILELIQERGVTLTNVGRSPDFTLYEIAR